MTARCATCGAPLLPTTRVGRCKECRWYELDRKLRAIEDAELRRQRATVVAARIQDLDAQSVQKTQPAQGGTNP